MAHDAGAAIELARPAPARWAWLRGSKRHALTAEERGAVAAATIQADTDEVFRGIYTRAGAADGRPVLAVSSAVAGEGATTVALGLAVAVARDFPGRSVVLVETDAEQPVLLEDLAGRPGPGLCEHLLGQAPLELVARPTALDNLSFVPAGRPSARGGRLLRSPQMEASLASLRAAYDTVILDLPPLLASSDAGVLADRVDGVVLVVRAGVTPQAVVQRALAQVDAGRLRGVVLNDTWSAAPGWLRRLSA